MQFAKILVDERQMRKLVIWNLQSMTELIKSQLDGQDPTEEEAYEEEE